MTSATCATRSSARSAGTKRTFVVKNRYIKALLYVGLALASTAALASHICWIDHVKRDKGTFKVYFSDRADLSVRLRKPGRPDQDYIYVRGALKSMSYEASGTGRREFTYVADSLIVENGDRVALRQGAHDHCILEIQESGIDVQALNTLPMQNPQAVHEFVEPDLP